MVTIKQEIKTSGNSLMKNKLCEVVIKPSQTGKIRIFSKGADVTPGEATNIKELFEKNYWKMAMKPWQTPADGRATSPASLRAACRQTNLRHKANRQAPVQKRGSRIGC